VLTVAREALSSVFVFIVVMLDTAARSLLLGLLNERKSDTLALGERDHVLLADTHAENVGKTGGEGVATSVLNVGNLIGTGMVLDVLQDTDATDVVTTSAENGGAILKLDNGFDGTGLQVELDGIVKLDVGVGEADSPAVVGNDIGDLVLADLLLDNLAELELSLFVVNSVRLEAALDVIEDTEVLAGLPDGDDVHEAEGVPVILSFSVVNFDVGTLVLHDLDAFLVGESKLETVLKENRHGDALTELVGAR